MQEDAITKTCLQKSRNTGKIFDFDPFVVLYPASKQSLHMSRTQLISDWTLPSISGH